MGMEMDSLDLIIESQVRNLGQINEVYNALGKVAVALNRTSTANRTAAREAGKMVAAFRALANIKLPDFATFASQLQALSKINLNNLQKTVGVKVELDAPQSAKQIEYALGKAVDAARIDSQSIADKLINEFHLQKNAKRAMNDAVKQLTSSMASGFDGSSFGEAAFEAVSTFFDTAERIIREHGRIDASSVFDISSNPQYSDFVAGRALDNKTMLSNISELRGDSAEFASQSISESLRNAFSTAQNSITSGFNTAMAKAADELTLNVQVNQDKITRDIQNAINAAATAEYEPVKVTLKTNSAYIENSIKKQLQEIKVGEMPAVADQFDRLINGIKTVTTLMGNDKSVNSLINALKRLASIDMSTFDSEKFQSITTAVATLAAAPDASGAITKTINSLTRLANASDAIQKTASVLPGFAAILKNTFETISQANVSETSERMLNAFTRLATSGEKAQAAATSLPDLTQAINDFFTQMSQVHEISDTTLRMTEAFTQLAVSGKRIASIGRQVGKSFNQVGQAGEKAGSGISHLSKHTNVVLSAFQKLLNVLKSAVSGIGNGAKRIVSHFKFIGNGSNHIQKATLSLKNLLQVALGFYGIRSLFNWGKEAVELASDLTEVQNVVENSFGTEGTATVDKFAKNAIEDFGMTELTAKRISSRFQAMGNAMGITSGQVAKATQNVADHLNPEMYDQAGEAMGAMSINLTKLAADMASFYNVDQENVAEALNAVYTGQTRPLRQYGLDLTVATLQEWANKQGIDAKVQSMTQAEKTMLRYQYVMANTSAVQGDFARTQSTWANQVRILKQNLQALASVVGGTLINAFKPFVTALNAAMSSVISFAETVGNALGKIFGWKILHTPASNAADAFNTLSDGLEDAGTSGDDAAGGIGKATKAAQEYKNTVLGFDELNKLNDIPDPTVSGGSGGGSGSGGGAGGAGAGDGSGADFQLVKADSWFEDYKSDIDNLYELGSYISEVLTKTLESIEWDKIYEGARNFGTGLASFLNGLIKPELFSAMSGFIAGAINTVLNAADAFLDKFDFKNLGKSIAAGVNRFFRDFDFGLSASVFYKAVNGIVRAIRTAAEDIQWGSIGSKISTCVKDALTGIDWSGEVYPAADTFGTKLAEFLNGLITPETFGTIGDSVARALNSALRVLNTFGNTFDFKNFGSSIAAAIRRFFYTWDPVLTGETFTKLAQGILDAIKSAVAGVKWFDVGFKIRTAILSINWNNLFVSLGSTIMTAINAAIDLAIGLFDGTPISDAFETLKTTVNNIADQIDFDTLKAGLKGIWDIGSKFVAGFMEGFTGAMGVLADIGVGVLSGIALAINWLAEGLNKLDPNLVKNIGTALGIVAASMGAINLAQGAVTTIGNLAEKFLGMGGAAATAAEGTTTVATETGKATGKIGGLAKELLTSVGAFEAFGIYGAVKAGAWLEMAGEKAQGYNGYLTEMGGVMTTVARQFAPEMGQKITDLNNDLENSGATTNEAVKAFVKFFKGEHVDYKDLQTAIIGAKGDISLTAEQAELLDGIMKLMGTDTEGTAKKIGGFAGSVGTARTDIERNSSGIRDSLGTALDTIGTKAEGADKKSDTFKTNIWGFAGGIAAQSILMAVMGATFTLMGDNAEGAETPITNLKTTVSNFVADVATNAETAKKNAEDVGKNTGQGMVDGITAKTEELKAAIQSVTVDKPQATMTSLWGINSPSTVTYGYGENIMEGMKNGLDAKSAEVVAVITSTVSSMQTQITGKYEEFRTNGRTLADKIKEGFKSVSFSDIPGTILDAIDFSRLYNSFKTAGGNAMDKFAQGMYNTNVKTPHMSFTTSVSGSGTSRTTSWSSSLSWYALGGFPNLGDLFVANERGPEMVGKMGNRNVVANNLQITEGIKSAVIDGMMEVAMSGVFGRDRSDQPIVVNATLRTENDEILARAVERGMAKRNDRFNPVSSLAYT